MVYHYIDFDNVRSLITPYLLQQDMKHDRFFIYMQSNMNRLDNQQWLDLIRVLYQISYAPEFIVCPAGKESSDKFIIADLGIDATRDNSRTYRVYSNDADNDRLYQHIAEITGADIKRIPIMSVVRQAEV